MLDVMEKHYTVAELAAAWKLSDDAIRRLFLDEPGVINLGKPSRRKRIYRPLRIPEHVAQRVYQRITNTHLSKSQQEPIETAPAEVKK